MVQDKGKLVHSHPANELTEKLFGIESVICKDKRVDATATSFIINSDVVPSGKIWKITYVAAVNYAGDIATRFHFLVHHDDTDIVFHQIATVVARYVTVDKHVELYLDADDYIGAYFSGVTIGEECRLIIFGYEMNAP